MQVTNFEWNDKSSAEFYSADEPDKCPICHKHIVANVKYGKEINQLFIQVVFSCNNKKCDALFIGSYSYRPIYMDGPREWLLDGLAPMTAIPIEKKESINEVSPMFYTIYGQALKAESLRLNEISGMGYRKSLEFLIKDYCISIITDNENKEEKEKEIKKKFLYPLILDNLKEAPKLQACAKRATWLGNDETHYVRKWETKNIKDLKLLIQLTLHHIEVELLTVEFEKEMN